MARDEAPPELTTLLEGPVKPQIYKVGATWILWVPGVRVYRFDSWESALRYALRPDTRITSGPDLSDKKR